MCCGIKEKNNIIPLQPKILYSLYNNKRKKRKKWYYNCLLILKGKYG